VLLGGRLCDGGVLGLGFVHAAFEIPCLGGSAAIRMGTQKFVGIRIRLIVLLRTQFAISTIENRPGWTVEATGQAWNKGQAKNQRAG
jgi:hypothetical protein